MTETRINKERAARARATLESLGVSQAALARVLGVSPRIVREVVRGRLIGVRGSTHKVAVALGLKDGEILRDGTTNAELLQKLRRAAKNQQREAA